MEGKPRPVQTDTFFESCWAGRRARQALECANTGECNPTRCREQGGCFIRSSLYISSTSRTIAGLARNGRSFLETIAYLYWPNLLRWLPVLDSEAALFFRLAIQKSLESGAKYLARPDPVSCFLTTWSMNLTLDSFRANEMPERTNRTPVLCGTQTPSIKSWAC